MLELKNDEWCSKTPNHKHMVKANYTTGDNICVGCGLVFDGALSQDLTYSDGEYPIYTHENLTDKNLGTSPKHTFSSTFGRTPNQRAAQRCLKRAANRFAFSNQERKLRAKLSDIGVLGEALQLPTHIRQIATMSYQKIHKSVKGRGRNQTRKMCGLLLACARAQNYPLSLRSIQKIMSFSRRDATMVSSNAVIFAHALGFQSKPTNKLAKLHAVATQINLPPTITEKSERIINSIEKTNIFWGYLSESVVGSVLYYMAQERKYPLTIDALTDYFGVSNATIRNGAQKVRDFLNNGGKKSW